MIFKGLAGTFAIWAVGLLLLRFTVAQEHRCPDVSPEEMETSAVAAADWIERSLLEDGKYIYEYDGASDTYPGGYNEVRHAGVTMSLYQYIEETGDLGPLATADRATGRMLEIAIEHDDWIAIRNPDTGTVKLGSSSLMLAGLALRREATGDTAYDETMRQLARFILVMQREDGSFLNFWLTSTGEPDPTVTSKYATGEAFWALALLHNLFPDEGWDEPAIAVADYLALYRDDAEGFTFQPWPDQWAAYGLSEMREWPIADHHVEYARTIAQRFGFLVRIESQRSDTPVIKEFHGRKTRAAGHGTWVEGITSLYRLAQADDRLADIRDDLGQRAICGAAMLVDRQVTPEEALEYPDPDVAEGAWFTEEITRMDDQQHALSGLIRTVPILREEEEE